MLTFLRKLKKNNNKPWFDANREIYAAAKSEFEAIIGSVILQYGKTDTSIAGLTPRNCIFRINRDVRFSKDKSPYKTNFGASISSGGKKSGLAGYYIHVEPGNSFVGGGLYMPMPDMLAGVRQEIDYQYDEFRKIITAPAFRKEYKELYKGDDVSLSRVPKGYDASHPAAEFLKLKSYIAMRPVSDQEIDDGKLEKISVQSFKALKPLVDFLNRNAL